MASGFSSVRVFGHTGLCEENLTELNTTSSHLCFFIYGSFKITQLSRACFTWKASFSLRTQQIARQHWQLPTSNTCDPRGTTIKGPSSRKRGTQYCGGCSSEQPLLWDNIQCSAATASDLPLYDPAGLAERSDPSSHRALFTLGECLLGGACGEAVDTWKVLEGGSLSVIAGDSVYRFSSLHGGRGRGSTGAQDREARRWRWGDSGGASQWHDGKCWPESRLSLRIFTGRMPICILIKTASKDPKGLDMKKMKKYI